MAAAYLHLTVVTTCMTSEPWKVIIFKVKVGSDFYSSHRSFSPSAKETWSSLLLCVLFGVVFNTSMKRKHPRLIIIVIIIQVTHFLSHPTPISVVSKVSANPWAQGETVLPLNCRVHFCVWLFWFEFCLFVVVFVVVVVVWGCCCFVLGAFYWPFLFVLILQCISVVNIQNSSKSSLSSVFTLLKKKRVCVCVCIT